ncbi:MAG: Uma2 family endonuclease [Chloroflexota bacterium]
MALHAYDDRMTVDEYIALERRSVDIKHEYIHGHVVAMVGASEEHNTININTSSSIHQQLKGRSCRPYSTDMRVRVTPQMYTYPDIIVVCGDPQFADDQFDTLLNPTLIIEILSPSTERYDRGRKFAYYREIDTFREYVLIAQDEPRIQRYLRHEDGEQWLFTEAAGLDATLVLTSIDCTLALSDVYDRIDFDADDEPPTEQGS